MGLSKTILLLCYEFPPYPSIGGRRWAKFAKYLAGEGHIIYVIAAQSSSSDNRQDSNWLKDIDSPNIFSYYIKSNYPYKLLKNKKAIGGRLLRKLYASCLEYNGKGIVQDKAIFWKRDLLKSAKELIAKHGIQNVISTGPPHRVNYYATLLKRDHPGLNIICDFRDTWLDGKVYGLQKISKRVLAAESRMESYTVKRADYLLFTYQPMLQDFKDRYPDVSEHKFCHFPHSYDESDYAAIRNVEVNSDYIQFLYGGTITSTAVTDAFTPFLKAVKQLQAVNSALYDKLHIIIYGNHAKLADTIQELDLGSAVRLYDKVPEEQFYVEAARSNFLLSFLGDDWKDYMTTKNIAYLPLRRPIVLVAKPGIVSEFIEKNKVGYVINPDYSFKGLSLLLDKFTHSSSLVNRMYDNTTFSYKNATLQLIKLLK